MTAGFANQAAGPPAAASPSARSRNAVTRAVHSAGPVARACVCDAPETVQVWTRSGAAARRYVSAASRAG